MKILTFFISLALLGHESRASCIADGDNSGRYNPTTEVLSDAILNYTLKQYKTMVADEQTKTENIFTSPYSIWSALTSTYLGSREEVSNELKTLLGLEGLRKSGVEERSSRLEEQLQGTEGDAFLVANKIAFDRSTVRLRQCIIEDPSISAEEFDFANHPSKSRVALNQWVEDATDGKIEDLLSEQDVTQMTAMILLNAVYFKGQWKYPFFKEVTRNLSFTSSTGAVSQVPMMTRTQVSLKYRHDADLRVQGVELPYKSGNFSMVLMLPDQDQTVDELVGSLDDSALKNFLERLEYHSRVLVTLPKFKLDKSIKMKGLLKNLGAPSMFEGINISGIVESSPGLAVSNVIHQAVVAVDEEGTEAAAATSIVVVTKMAGLRGPHLTFDRPFLFMIKSTNTDALLFMGVVRKL